MFTINTDAPGNADAVLDTVVEPSIGAYFSGAAAELVPEEEHYTRMTTAATVGNSI